MTRPGVYGFRGTWHFLSNMYLEPDNTCVETAYQAAKCADFTQRKGFEGLNGYEAKVRGQQVKLRPDWEQVKVDIMLFHVAKKFRDHPTLARSLALTEPMYLEETNNWHDEFWGVCDGTCRFGPHKRQGQNILGAILMEVRDQL